MDLVDILFDIFQNSCPTTAVPHEYMNIFRQFTKIYLNSVEPRDTNNTEGWDNIVKILATCKNDTKLYDFVSKGMKVSYYINRTQNI